MRLLMGCLPLLAIAAIPPPPTLAQTNAAPTVSDKAVVSLFRARPEWEVRTTVCLEGRDADSKTLTFQVVEGARNGKLVPLGSCALDPGDADSPLAQRSARYLYQPTVGFTGRDEFTYVAIDEQMGRSQPGTVAIDVRNEGLRWELLTLGATGLTGDADSLTDIPKVIGKTAQDFLFVLNWQPASPGQTGTRGAAGWPVTRTGKLSRAVSVLFETGVRTGEAAVKARRLLAVDGASPTAANEPTSEASVASQRHFTSGGQVNINAVADADGQGTYVELGFTGKGHLDVFVDDAQTSQRSAGQFIQLLREGDTFFRGEAGARVALKQYRENSASVVFAGGQRIVYPSNLDELVYVELLWQRNNATGQIDVGGGDSRNRYAVRIAAQPQLVNVPGRPKFLIGIEVTRAISGGRPSTKVFYGLNLSGNRLF
jgi:hypothetical protein